MSKAERDAYDALMAIQVIEGLSNEVLLANIGRLIDLSGDLNQDAGTARALEWCEILEKRSPPDPQAALLEYFRGNAWNNRRREKHRDKDAAWSWEQPELQKEIFHLRRAVIHPGFDDLHPLRRCQTYTNLANQMNTVGRFVEAVEYWDRALSINPQFGKALGNRGCGLVDYAVALYDTGHQALFCHLAYKALNVALSSRAKYQDIDHKRAKKHYGAAKARIEAKAKLGRRFDIDGHSIGASEKERQYRQWCLENRLFLNPLNDLGPHSIAARDILVLPGFVTSIDEPPTLIGFFNQMKQEFVSARWLYYEGVHAQRAHFSDRDVRLFNTLDYPSYGLAVEKTKAAFGITYSIFDKIGFFLNDYMRLGIDGNNVYFKTIWYRDYKKRELRPEFEESKNQPLRGLRWLAKDLFEKDFEDVMEPDAEALYEIRNHLEHKYLKVHEMLIPQATGAMSSAWIDRLAHSVERQDFEAKTLRLLRLARAGMIYLSLGMHREETRRRKAKGDTIVAPMTLDLWEDKWKR
jgi:tetratricopeptide (TPR) repeat protein